MSDIDHAIMMANAEADEREARDEELARLRGEVETLLDAASNHNCMDSPQVKDAVSHLETLVTWWKKVAGQRQGRIELKDRALEFYAKRENYRDPQEGWGETVTMVSVDDGDKARAALAPEAKPIVYHSIVEATKEAIEEVSRKPSKG